MTAPITTADYNGNFRNVDFHINLDATDFSGTGIYETFYRINLGPLKKISTDGQPLISSEGTNNVLEFWSRDNQGNQEQVKTITRIKLDKTPPYELNDLSQLNGQTKTSVHDREILIEVKDNLSLANTITLKFLRHGYDSTVQSKQLQLETAGVSGTYKGTIDENPDPTNIDVDSISYWIVGEDEAGNAITIGGDHNSPLTQYLIDDFSPVFRDIYQENSRIGQTKTVKNLGYTNKYVNGQIISLEISLNKSIFLVGADFSQIDNNYTPGQEFVSNLGNGFYHIFYEISEGNPTRNSAHIKITATDGIHETSDNSYIAISQSALSVMNSVPGHSSLGTSIDTAIVLQFNAEILPTDLITGFIYLTDSCNRGIPIDIDIENNIIILRPIKRLKPNETYIIHVNPHLPSMIGNLDHYNEIVFSTAPFFPPLIPPGYTVTNMLGSPLTIDDMSMSLSNGKDMFIEWPILSNDLINGADLREAPIMLSENTSAVLWADTLDIGFANPGYEPVIKIKNLELENPQISHENSIMFFGGITKDPAISSVMYSNNELSIKLKKINSIFVSESEKPSLLSDGQDNIIRLYWCFPENMDIDRIVLIKNNIHIPESPTDGQNLAIEVNESTLYDIEVENGLTVYYRLFVYDNFGREYNFNLSTQQTPSPEYKITYEYGKHEANLISIERDCNFLLTAQNNAVIDTATNGNQFSDKKPIFLEYRLGKNDKDKTNHIIEMCESSVTMEINTNLATHLMDECNIFVVFERGAAKDKASNPTEITLIKKINLKPDFDSFSLINSRPIND